MAARAFVLVVLVITWLHVAPAAAGENVHHTTAREVPEPMHADLVRGLDPEPGELEANLVAIAPLGHGDRGIAWAPEIEWAPTRRAAFELELPLVGPRLETVKLSTQLTLMRPRGRRPAQGVLVSAALPLHRDAAVQATHLLAAHIGRRFGLVTQLGPHITVHAASSHAAIGIVVGAAAFVSLRDGNALGLEAGWTHDAKHSELELLPQVHVHVAEHVRLQLGLGARHQLGTRHFDAIAGLRVIVER